MTGAFDCYIVHTASLIIMSGAAASRMGEGLFTFYGLLGYWPRRGTLAHTALGKGAIHKPSFSAAGRVDIDGQPGWQVVGYIS